MEIFGSLERLMSDLYPYRYAIGATAIALVVALGFVVWWRGWYRGAQRHPRATVITTVVTLAIAIPLGYYLLSPLWTRTTLVEESPLALVNNASTTRAATSTPATAAVAPAASSTTDTTALAAATATERASGGQAVTDASTATSVPMAPAAVTVAPEGTQPAQPTQEQAAPEPAATDVPPAPEPEPAATEPPAQEPVATEVPPAPEPEPEPVVFQPHVTHSGEFFGADDFHFGSGTTLIIQTEPGVYVLRFENFSVRNGPDLYVYLSTNPDGASANDYSLGALKATDGSFNYDIPAGVDVSIYRSVIIWCEPFAVLFATAPLFAVE